MATNAQLAALAKGRAALAKKRKTRKVPTTKAGKPDKRYVKSVGAKSKATGKAPSKRTQARRAKPQVAGYSANPVKNYYTVYAVKGGAIVAYWNGATFDTDRYKQALYTTPSAAKSVAEDLAGKILAGYRVGYGRESDPVKKPVAGNGRKSNPVPASKALKAKEAIALWEDFTGHKADHYINAQVDWPDVGLQVGQCDGILYSTVRDGVHEKYIHRFKKSARPLLAASYDGAQLALIGGNFRFTNRGIVDN